jgi:hypothetical protein
MLSAGHVDKNPCSVRSCSSPQAVRKADHFVKALALLIWQSTLLIAPLALAGCPARTARSGELQSLTPASAATTAESVCTFMRTVAPDVTQDGPLALDLPPRRCDNRQFRSMGTDLVRLPAGGGDMGVDQWASRNRQRPSGYSANPVKYSAWSIRCPALSTLAQVLRRGAQVVLHGR